MGKAAYKKFMGTWERDEEGDEVCPKGVGKIAERASVFAKVASVIVVMDLITEEQYNILVAPYAQVLKDLGILWFSSVPVA
jgi:L-asparagine transporter-like permease